VQFARLSHLGDEWIAENGAGAIMRGRWGDPVGTRIGYGISPQWLAETPAWVSGYEVRTQGITTPLATLTRPLNGLTTGGEHWAAWSSESVWSGARWLEERSQPAVSSGGMLVVVTSDARLVTGADTGVSPGPARLPRFSGGVLAWIEEHASRLEVRPAAWGVYTDAHAVIPCETHADRWLVVLEDDRLVAHPFGNPYGYVIEPTPTTFRPDAVGLDRTLRVVWDTPHGLTFREVDLTQPRVYLPRSTPPPIDPPVEPPVKPPEPPMSMPPYLGSPEEEKWLGDQFKQDYDEAGRPADYDTITWGARTYYDYCSGLSMDASVRKHRNECRAGLGLPPL
jgi:hypothetical protein